jgi:tetratricopeptide (TPR) repeat protein
LVKFKNEAGDLALMGISATRKTGLAVLLILLACAGPAQSVKKFDSVAVRLNNRGVALMGQQSTQKALDSFDEAFKKDPKFAQAAVNQGIALMALQKLDDAKRVLRQAVAVDPGSAQAWYVLGLVQHSANETEAALADFKQVVKLNPRDADSYYFQGLCYQELKQFDEATEALEQALKVDPLHASSEFVLARTLQRTGHTPEARQHFQRFQHLTSTKISSAIGQGYGEQGRYSTVTAVEEPETISPTMIPIQLAAQSLPALSGGKPTGGACMADITGTGQMDLVLMQDGAQAINVLHRQSNGTFAAVDAVAAGLKASGHAVACSVGDMDADGLNDLAVAMDDRILLFRNLGRGKFSDVTAKSGIVARNHPAGITFVDYDHDSDLDILITGSPLKLGGAANVLWRDNGDGTYTEQTDATGMGGSGSTASAILTDFNNDRAVDLAITGDGVAPTIYVNPREGKYPVQPVYQGTGLPATTGIAVLDYNKDGWMDFALTHTGAPGITLWRNVVDADHVSRRFERVELPLHGALRGWGVTPVDIDNDGWIDLAVIVETSAGAQVRIFRNRGNGSFVDVSHMVGLDAVRLQQARGLIAADIDGDGAPDLIVTQLNAPPVLLRNQGANKNHSVRLDLTGFADNKTALGVKVEVFANGLWQKWELPGASGYQTQAPPQILVGLGNAQRIDMLRILWPTGVLQDEIDLPQGPVIAMKEADRRGSSCPALFTWDGHHYKFVNDVIGAAVVGHWFTPTRRNIPRSEEWIKVDGDSFAEVDGKLSLRFMEPMEEVNYIDQLRLVAVDHPANVIVNPDERFLDEPPFATGKVVASADVRLPVGAWDGNGKDVLSTLSAQDHQFASGFEPIHYDGFANLHPLTLDLGSLKPGAPLRLLLTGYINYFSATSLYGAWQGGVKPISPYVEAELPDGSWQRVLDDAGFPAGLERTIVVDLTGKLPAETKRIRLMTNLQIYWDQVQIDQSIDAEARTTELPLSAAALHFRGFPKEINLQSPGDLDYNYDVVSLTGPFQHERGNYTRLGVVTPLIQDNDDQFVIFGAGEEIAAQFDVTGLPKLPPDWKRDYFFYASGYEKDMDWWDALPFTVAQLPFHSMSAYPYPPSESFPDDKTGLSYQLEWNDRFDSGEPWGRHVFDYQLLPTTPRNDLAQPADK